MLTTRFCLVKYPKVELEIIEEAVNQHQLFAIKLHRFDRTNLHKQSSGVSLAHDDQVLSLEGRFKS